MGAIIHLRSYEEECFTSFSEKYWEILFRLGSSAISKLSGPVRLLCTINSLGQLYQAGAPAATTLDHDNRYLLIGAGTTLALLRCHGEEDTSFSKTSSPSTTVTAVGGTNDVPSPAAATRSSSASCAAATERRKRIIGGPATEAAGQAAVTGHSHPRLCTVAVGQAAAAGRRYHRHRNSIGY